MTRPAPVLDSPVPGRERDAARVLAAAVVAASAFVLVAYARDGLALFRYPWDWSPDEGLTLDYARRVIENPGQLYARSAVPFPLAYGPLLPVLLAPVVAHAHAPMAVARLLALSWTLLGAAAVFELVRRRAGPLLGWASAGLHLAPLAVSFWHVLVRVDGLMTSLWLLAAIPLLPRALERGSDRLSPGRIVGGAALLLTAILTKPTALVHGLPLVIGWWFVDRKSAAWLAAAVGSAGLATVGILQWTTSGGFLWVNRLWSLHPSVAWQRLTIVLLMVRYAWPVPLLALLGAWRATRAGSQPWREPSLLLVVGGLLIAPAMSKQGAWWNYLLPALAAIVVFGGSVWRGVGPSSSWPRRRPVGALAIALVSLIMVLTSSFPLPDAEDERTARSLYAMVRALAARSGGPLLVSRPDYAYFDNHQPAEIEGSSFPHLFEARVRGTEKVIERVRRREYGVIVWAWPFPAEIEQAIDEGYRYVGVCRVRFYYSLQSVYVYAPTELGVRFVPLAGTRCGPPDSEHPRFRS